MVLNRGITSPGFPPSLVQPGAAVFVKRSPFAVPHRGAWRGSLSPGHSIGTCQDLSGIAGGNEEPITVDQTVYPVTQSRDLTP